MEEQLIIILQGREDGGKAATLGTELALTMQTMEQKVSLFLTLGGTHWAYVGAADDVHVPGHMPLSFYLDGFLDAGGDLMVCAPCVAAYCHLPDISQLAAQQALLPQARYVGLATVAEKLMHADASVF